MKTKTMRILWPLWLYELFLMFSHRVSFTEGFFLTLFTVLASMSFTFVYK